MICAVCRSDFSLSSSNERFCSRKCYFAYPPLVEAERFWTKVDKKTSDCWLWTAKRNGLGYGQFWAASQRTELAHRASWRLTNGPIPDGVLVCHRCDVPSCVNPDHLFLGSNLDNYHDCNRKGRRPSLIGWRNGNARLTSIEVEKMRAEYTRGVTRISTLARKFGISTGHASHILSGRLHGGADPAAIDVLGILGFGS